MTQPDRPARRVRRHGPTRRTDSTRPASGPRSTRRGGDRRPYPTASTTTRVSPAKPGSTAARAPSRSSAQTPTPATVWAAGPASIDLATTWPTPIVASIVAALSRPGGRVALLPWPVPRSRHTHRPRLGVVGADGVISRGPDPAPGADPDADPDGHVAATLAAIEDLDRSARVVRVAAERNPAEPSSRPFWADLVGDSEHGHVSASAPSLPDVDRAVLDGPDVISADTDLIITSLPSAADGDHASDHASDLVALAAARLLRVGGVLAVITHSDSSRGELVDSTGLVVASAQNADLLYLQHIVALHVPARGGRFATELIPDTDGSLAEHQARAAHRAAVRGLPAPHRRIHSDVLVFAQPHEHEPLVQHAAMNPAEQARETGVIR